MVEKLQTPRQLLGAAARKGGNVERTEKAVPVNQADDLPVALGEPHGGHDGDAFEAGKTECHRATLPETGRAVKASGFALRGKSHD